MSDVIIRDREGNVIEILPGPPDVPPDPNFVDVPTAIDPGHVQEMIVLSVQSILDSVSQTRGYDNILSLCTYASSSIPKFRAEGQAGVDWRDACWAKCYEIMYAVETGARPLPTVEEAVAEMPEIGWV